MVSIMIGKKIKGFKFENGLNGIAFTPEMFDNIGRIGTVAEEATFGYRIDFDYFDDYFADELLFI